MPETMSWVDADGTEHPLTFENIGDLVNLVPNPSFEVDLDGWGQSDFGTASMTPERDESESAFGGASMRLDQTVAGEGDSMYVRVAATPGETYVASAYYNCTAFTAGAENDMGLWALGRQGSTGTYWDQPSPTTITAVSAGWVRVSQVVTLSDTSDQVEVRLHAPQGTIFWDAVQVELAAVASDYVDGSRPDGLWEGEEHASASRRVTSTGGARALKGVEGRFMPPVALVEEEVPFQPGAHLRHTKILVREVGIPVLFRQGGGADLRTYLREWLVALNVFRGPGILRVTAPDGAVRDLNAIYAGGMELVEDEDTAGDGWQKAVLVFRAHDPYWYDRNETTQTFELASTEAPFFPFFPLVLTSSEFFGSTSINNTGDVDAWPTWIINGPGQDPALRNLTTGKILELTHTLGADESVEIDTRPGVKTVTDQDGESLYSSMVSGSALWPIQKGHNTISVEMASATEETTITLRYRRRFLSA